MNLAAVLKSMGIDLADVEANAKKIVSDMKAELTSLHKKIDTLTSQNAAIGKALIAMDEKLDAIARIHAGESLKELVHVNDASGNNGNRGNSNGGNDGASASNASGN